MILNKQKELTIKYYDLWGATLMHLITEAGVHNVIDANILEQTDRIVKNAIKKPDDIMYHHNKLMQMRFI